MVRRLQNHPFHRQPQYLAAQFARTKAEVRSRPYRTRNRLFRSPPFSHMIRSSLSEVVLCSLSSLTKLSKHFNSCRCLVIRRWKTEFSTLILSLWSIHDITIDDDKIWLKSARSLGEIQPTSP